MLTLACGLYFSTVGVWTSLAVLIAVKPITYFAFIQAFRYRVSRGIPMGFGQAAGLALLRALAGAAIVGLLYPIVQVTAAVPLAWLLLTAERLIVWWLIGDRLAHLRGRRLAGWTMSGAAIDAAFDVVIGSSVLDVWAIAAGLSTAITVFIVALTVVGRRGSLKARFSGAPLCTRCQYDLTGNLSGLCPECGMPVVSPVVA